ncbi:hypothetical protein [Reichenbachiella agariperforans]|uniref:hypothetical protein n=1 Tax=Reichenbachiella agariperforans TaxID=156994 RepID=UPI001C098E41|nr:hypothetical protein [Reichenbachiella agariperforans]MBU2912474.1 hypothetical protein [Reichenbachiella agariperforans]
MRYYSILLALLLSCGTTSQQQGSQPQTIVDSTSLESLSDLLGAPEQVDSISDTKEEAVKPQLKSDVKLDSSHCSIQTLVYVDQNFEDLSIKDINSFLKTFHLECNNNVEFSEWSNELLFKVLDTYTQTTINLLTTRQEYDLSAILDELENPIHDFLLNQLVEKVEQQNIEEPIANQVIQALNIAASKD